eukprot:TRINITY_DN547_c0_g1_i1.p1 TRINITY_DN547_c0_g1~~TRINITY_DN547_c0_g1_i1.p1  ORF type:complete len:342 (+),score=62.78 TRINITY_DN547_c0_g1_i1:56-1081(+)
MCSDMIKIGLNGFGRIGRLIVRIAMIESNHVQLVAVNYPSAQTDRMAYLLKYDSVHGKYDGEVEFDDDHIIVNGHAIRTFHTREPGEIPWAEAGVDYVVDATGVFKTMEGCQPHLDAGAKRVIITAPSPDAPMFVMGVNHNDYSPDMKIVSNASCTTNCLGPIVRVIDEAFGIKSGLMTTVHSLTPSQNLFDGNSSGKKDWRNGRAANLNIIPGSTGAAIAVGHVYPKLEGKLTGMAFRVPVQNVSVVDVTINLENEASYEEICQTVKEASEGEMNGIIRYCDSPLVSSDFIGDPHSCIFDARAGISLDSKFCKIVCWYDNEWGYAYRVVDLLQYVHAQDQ